MKPVRLSKPARRDARAIIRWSEDRFGAEAADRYLGLILRGVQLIGREPNHIASRRVGAGEVQDYRVLHLRHVAQDAPMVVRKPRHLLAYRETARQIEVVRILHDSMDIARHLPSASKRRGASPK